jgi:ABC-type transport system involved in multi-copper enzyme maturation permease subunit
MATSSARLVRRPAISAFLVAGILVVLAEVAIIAMRGGVILTGLGVLFVLALIGVWRLPRLVGPVFFYDLIRTTRRGRYALARTLYAIVLMAMFLVVLDSWLTSAQARNRPDWSGAADQLFTALVLAQLAAVTLLTPAYTIGAIIDEKERRTIEYLLATDLTSDEIIFGKLFSRLANMFLLLLTGIPILSLLQLLGGVDPLLLLMAVAATAILLVSVASISLLCSLYARRSASAILVIYIGLAFYMIVLPMLRSLFGPGSVLDWLNIGNPFMSLQQAFEAATVQQTLSAAFLEALALFAAFHGILTAVCLIWAIVGLRAVVLKSARRRRSLGKSLRSSRRIFGPPMLWKEMYCRNKTERQMRLLLLLLTVGTLALGPWISSIERTLADLGFFVPTWTIHGSMRAIGTLLSCLLLLSIALKASTAVTRERERQTLDSLATTALATHDIAVSKWLAATLSVRYLMLWLMAIWTLGVVCGALSWISMVVLCLALLVYAAACASVGLWVSTLTRTSAQAQMAALSAIAALTLWHFLLLPVTMPLRHQAPFQRTSVADDFENFAFIALTPPYTMTCLAFNDGDFYYSPFDQRTTWRGNLPAAEFALMAATGLAIWGALAIGFYWLAYRALRRRRGNAG